MDIDNIVSDLKAQRNRIDQAVSALEGSALRRGRPPKSASGKRTMSPAARKRISAAMKLRWAKWKGKSARKNAAVPAKKSSRRPQISSAGRKRLSELMKARWAARKKAGATAL
jgi:hypothetical protein